MTTFYDDEAPAPKTCKACGEETFPDCWGRERCETCDGPCPGCYDGPGPGETDDDHDDHDDE